MQVLDLLDAGLVHVDEEIEYLRPQAGERYLAIIDRRGHLRLPDGQVFKTLSGAASTLSGTQVDGWEAWTLPSSGARLDALRQQLLELNAQDIAQDISLEEPGESLRDEKRRLDRHRFLREARDLADEGSPVVIGLKDLLAHWGVTARDGDVNDQIAAELTNYGLVADPDFASMALGDKLSLRSSSDAENLVGDAPHSQSKNSSQGINEPVERVVPRTTVRGVTIGTLPSASAGVLSINPQANLEEAITKMVINDYSQLAVMIGERNLKGAISWKSIARARNINPATGLASAIVPAREFPLATDLIEALPVLDEDDFFFVRGATNEIAGIVTAADVVSAYRDMASPFLMIGEIDQMLRRIIEVTWDSALITTVCDPDGRRSLTSVTQLTIGDYKQILDHHERWGELEWRLDRKVFCERLDEVRKIRNQVMHFNGDPVAESTMKILRHFIQTLREYGTI